MTSFFDQVYRYHQIKTLFPLHLIVLPGNL